MHRNTYLLVIVLSVFAALLVGVNVGKRLQKQSPLPPVPTPTPSIQTYTNTYCGFSLDYPAAYTVLENASGSAILHNAADKTQSITLTCQKAIPRPPLAADKIGAFFIPAGSISATLYHDASPKDGTPIDVLLFHHPRGMDVFVAGYGSAFDAAIKTLQILP